MKETMLSQSLANLGKDGIYIVCDTESTGFAPNDTYSKLLQVSAMRTTLSFNWDEKAVHETTPEVFNSYVNPELPYLPPRKAYPDEKRRSKIPKKIVELTGITDKDVEDAPAVRDVLTDYYRFMGLDIPGDYPLYFDEEEKGQEKFTAAVYHNAPHDVNFLHFFGSKFGLDFRSQPVIDTYALAKYLWPDLGTGEYKLEALAKRFSISDPNHHNAVNDVSVTLNLLIIEINEMMQRGLLVKPGTEILYDKVESSYKYDIVRMALWETPDRARRRVYITVKENRSYATVWYDFVADQWGQKPKQGDFPVREFGGIQEKAMGMLSLPDWNWGNISAALSR